MEKEFKWIITQLDTKPQFGDLLDVVSVVHWRRNLNQDGFTAEAYGTLICGTPSETDFTAYPDLTIEQVESWLESGLDVNEIDFSLESEISDQKFPPIVTLPLPWLKEA